MAATEKLTRIAIVDADKCKPKKCRQECKKSCPVVRMGKLCIEVTPASKLAWISEELCIGCGICVKKCPFEAIQIINLPKNLEKDTTHRYGPNSFKLHRLPMPRPGQVLGLVGTNGIGKCFAAGTLVLMADGSKKKVEEIRGGDLVQGDNNIARTVLNGSEQRGNALMYKIQPESAGQDSFVVNGDHILVIKVNSKPSIHHRDNNKFSLSALRFIKGKFINKTIWNGSTRDGAERAKAEEDATPLIVEISVKEYFDNISPIYKAESKMFKPESVEFTGTAGGLASIMRKLGLSCLDNDLELTSWLIGLWLTNGAGVNSSINIGSEEIFSKCASWASRFNVTLNRSHIGYSSSGSQIYNISFSDNLFSNILEASGLSNNKSKIPHFLLVDNVNIRRSLFAGLLDGDGSFNSDSKAYEIASKSSELLQDYKFLALSLGLRVSEIQNHIVQDKISGIEFPGFRACVSGNNFSSISSNVAFTSKALSENWNKMPNEDSNSWGFNVEKVGNGNYYGFQVDGNGRFLLGDFTVTHNSTALMILAGKLKPNLGKFDAPPDWQQILVNFRGSELQNFFTKLLEDNIRAIIKPQYVDSIPKSVKGTVKEIIERKDDRKQKEYAYDVLDLENVTDREISVLSGGELQRFAIAATFVQEADMYMFDEPSSYLDVKQRLKAAQVIRELCSENKYIICVEHDLSVLDYLSDYICCLYGKPGAYGVVTAPFSVREGINIFLAGFVPTENLRFRTVELSFKVAENVQNQISEEAKRFTTTDYPEMKKTIGTFSLEVRSGGFSESEIIIMLGQNGTGKTTFIKMLAGLDKPDEGNKVPLLNVSYKPQKIAPKFVGTVRQLFHSKINATYIHPQFIADVMKPLNIEDLIDREVVSLSGGELQRVAITLSLGKPADIYLIDEPSAYLDSEQRIVASKVIKRFILHSKKTAFIVEHDFIMATYLADRVIVYEGEPARKCVANTPQPLLSGMNKFLKDLAITFRRDPTNHRPRINKLNSVKDKEQKLAGSYFYLDTEEDDEDIPLSKADRKKKEKLENENRKDAEKEAAAEKKKSDKEKAKQQEEDDAQGTK